jgi:hypothetical protein
MRYALLNLTALVKSLLVLVLAEFVMCVLAGIVAIPVYLLLSPLSHSARMVLEGFLVLCDGFGCAACERTVPAMLAEAGLHFEDCSARRIVGKYPIYICRMRESWFGVGVGVGDGDIWSDRNV